MKALVILLIFVCTCSCSNKKTIHHHYLQDLVVIDKIYHLDDNEESYEYIIVDSFGKTFSYTTAAHFCIGDKIEIIVKPN